MLDIKRETKVKLYNKPNNKIRSDIYSLQEIINTNFQMDKDIMLFEIPTLKDEKEERVFEGDYEIVYNDKKEVNAIKIYGINKRIIILNKEDSLFQINIIEGKYLEKVIRAGNIFDEEEKIMELIKDLKKEDLLNIANVLINQ